jgi:hypothetical protein
MFTFVLETRFKTDSENPSDCAVKINSNHSNVSGQIYALTRTVLKCRKIITPAANVQLGKVR